MGEFSIEKVSWDLSIEDIHTLAYHIGYNEPKFPTEPNTNLEFKESLTNLLRQLNDILDLDNVNDLVERQWKMKK